MNGRRRNRGVGTIFKRTGSPNWWIQYSKGNHRVRESSGTTDEEAARGLLVQRQGEAEAGPAADRKRITVAELPARLKREYQNEEDPTPERAQRYAARVGQYFAHLVTFFGGRPAKEIRREAIEDYVDHRRKEGAKASTIRSEVAALARGLTLALKRRPSLPTIRVKNTRKGFFTGTEIAALLPYLQDYMQAFTEAAFITGWRRGELRSMTWAQVDWDRGVLRLDPLTTKNDEGREFPFAAHPRLEALLRDQRKRTSELEKATGGICSWVFHRDGHPVCWFYDGWKTACDNAGVPGRLFHDLRRSAVRNLIDAGVPQSVAMTITGHKTASVFRRYEIRDGADVVEAVKKLAVYHEASAPRPAKVLRIGGR